MTRESGNMGEHVETGDQEMRDDAARQVDADGGPARREAALEALSSASHAS